MWAYKYNVTEINKVKINIPEIRSNDVLVKIDKVTICGTDLHIFENDDWAKKTINPGIIIGHEGCGTIVKIGSEVNNFSEGDYVALESHFACPNCEILNRNSDKCNHYGITGLYASTNKNNNNHKVNGVFSEYIAIPHYCCYKISSEIKEDLASASLLESAGNTWEIIRYIKNNNLKAKSIAIFGCGPHSLNLQLFAKSLGIEKIIAFETNPERIDFAKQFEQATEVLNPNDISWENLINDNDGGFDIVIDVVGNQKIVDICKKITKDKGHIILFGLPKKDSIIINNRSFNQIIFNSQLHNIEYEGKKIIVKGFTGRSSKSWSELLCELNKSSIFRKKLSQPLKIAGNLHDIESFIKQRPSGYLKVGFQIE